jgi:NADH:ubiquinone oxidoreductase subunit 6 (subunit J)
VVLETIYGLLFAAALFSAIMVVLSPHAVYAALFLVATMISISGLFLLMNAQLAAAFQLIVYAGAIMVLFLFVIMLLNIGHQGRVVGRNGGIRWMGGALALAFVFQMVVLLVKAAGGVGWASHYSLANPPNIGISQVGFILQSDYVYAFAMTSILLLVAMIGAVVMARRHLIQGVVDETADKNIRKS